jgi:hypothetical protein
VVAITATHTVECVKARQVAEALPFITRQDRRRRHPAVAKARGRKGERETVARARGKEICERNSGDW